MDGAVDWCCPVVVLFDAFRCKTCASTEFKRGLWWGQKLEYVIEKVLSFYMKTSLVTCNGSFSAGHYSARVCIDKSWHL